MKACGRCTEHQGCAPSLYFRIPFRKPCSSCSLPPVARQKRMVDFAHVCMRSIACQAVCQAGRDVQFQLTCRPRALASLHSKEAEASPHSIGTLYCRLRKSKLHAMRHSVARLAPSAAAGPRSAASCSPPRAPALLNAGCWRCRCWVWAQCTPVSPRPVTLSCDVR